MKVGQTHLQVRNLSHHHNNSWHHTFLQPNTHNALPCTEGLDSLSHHLSSTFLDARQLFVLLLLHMVSAVFHQLKPKIT